MKQIRIQQAQTVKFTMFLYSCCKIASSTGQLRIYQFHQSSYTNRRGEMFKLRKAPFAYGRAANLYRPGQREMGSGRVDPGGLSPTSTLRCSAHAAAWLGRGPAFATLCHLACLPHAPAGHLRATTPAGKPPSSHIGYMTCAAPAFQSCMTKVPF